MKYILLTLCILNISCTTLGHVDTEQKTITLKGYGAESFSWEGNGEKYSITRGQAIPIPDIIPTR